MHHTLYLNNDGSRWVFTDPEGMKVYLFTKDGGVHLRKVRYWFSFGNFAGCAVKYKGKVIQRLPQDCEKYDGLPVIKE